MAAPPSQSCVLVAKTYRLIQRVGEGSFGKIFAARHKDTGEEFAVKLVPQIHAAIYANEVAIYEKIKDLKYVPSLYAAGTEGKYHYMVIDLLEQSVEQLKEAYGDRMQLKVVVHLGLQMLALLESLHGKGIIHRDVKPANFLLKTNKHQVSEIYLIDFGLAGWEETEKKDSARLIGTHRYMSVNVQQCLAPAGRRDDLESLGYILLYLQLGELPWQGQSETESLARKQQLTFSAVAAGEFILFIHYCRTLSLGAAPNYDYLRTLLSNLNKII
jgi:serine/threonine protein kinase